LGVEACVYATADSGWLRNGSDRLQRLTWRTTSRSSCNSRSRSLLWRTVVDVQKAPTSVANYDTHCCLLECPVLPPKIYRCTRPRQRGCQFTRADRSIVSMRECLCEAATRGGPVEFAHNQLLPGQRLPLRERTRSVIPYRTWVLRRLRAGLSTSRHFMTGVRKPLLFGYDRRYGLTCLLPSHRSMHDNTTTSHTPLTSDTVFTRLWNF